jgi:predicted naringenin-chalcone synthase
MSKADVKGKTVVVTPAITAGAYSASDNIGGKMTLTGAMWSDGGAAVLVSVLVTDKANIKAPMQLVIFDADPTAATLTDNAADWITIGSMGFASVSLVRAIEGAAGSTNLWAAAMVTGTPTFVSVADLTFKFGLERY